MSVQTGNYVRTADAIDLTVEDSLLAFTDFDEALIEATLFTRIFNKLNNELFSRRDRVYFSLQEVSRQSFSSEPTFLISHIMSPHPPFLFDREGNNPEISTNLFGKPAHLQSDIRGYTDQVHYLNTQLKVMIEDILSNSEQPPIIILQGDHGLRVTDWDNKPKSREELENSCLRELFSNLNAVYLPDLDRRHQPYDTMSPVNTFRMIFDNYFGSDLGLLPDRSFYALAIGKNEDSSIAEITGKQDTCSPTWTSRFNELHK